MKENKYECDMTDRSPSGTEPLSVCLSLSLSLDRKNQDMNMRVFFKSLSLLLGK